jgi:hypothetical protein
VPYNIGAGIAMNAAPQRIIVNLSLWRFRGKLDDKAYNGRLLVSLLKLWTKSFIVIST